MTKQSDLPYCGAPPLPEDLLFRWNFDAALIVVMASLLLLQIVVLRQSSELRTKSSSLVAGWALLFILFISPFCALTSALFSTRVAHHVLLVAVVAPLLVLSLPERWRHIRFSPSMLGALFVAQTLCFWLWHAPAAYALALQSSAAYWVMQASLIISATLLWLAILSRATPLTSSAGLLLGAVIQMGLLGALLTFARAPLYLAHLGVTEPFGLTAHADQQLAGLIMWVPASIPYVYAAIALMVRQLARSDRTEVVC